MSCSISQYAHTHLHVQHVHIRMHTCNIYIYIYMCVCMYACMHACIFIFTYTYSLFEFTCIFILIFIYTLSNINIRKPEYTLTQQNTLISTLPTRSQSNKRPFAVQLGWINFPLPWEQARPFRLQGWLYGHRVQRCLTPKSGHVMRAGLH